MEQSKIVQLIKEAELNKIKSVSMTTMKQDARGTSATTEIIIVDIDLQRTPELEEKQKTMKQ